MIHRYHQSSVPREIEVKRYIMPTAITKESVPKGLVVNETLATEPASDLKESTPNQSVNIENEILVTDTDLIVTDVEFFTPKKDNAKASSIIDDIALDVPAEISAVTSIANSRKDSLLSSLPSVLSPSSHTRSQTTRKRSTPEKYVPTMVATVRRSIDLTSSRKKSKSSNTKKKGVEQNEVEIVDDDSTVVNEETSVIDNDDAMRELERDSLKKKSVSELDPDNTELADEAEESERRFMKRLFHIKVRNGNRISWAGFLLGYCREIVITEYAKQYMRTRK
jgi:hypothetical protein